MGIIMDTAIFTALAISLVLTIIIEAGFFSLIGKRNKKDLLLVILVNVLTNPVVVLLYWLAAYYTDISLIIVKIPLEVFAVTAEGYCYKKYALELKRPYAFSLAANAISFLSGILIQQII